jgi:deoxyribonuclease-4
MRFGAHVPTRGRLSRAIDYAVTVGAETIQLFISNPRGWAAPPVRDEQVHEFDARRRRAGIDPVFVHSSYLINIASPDPRFLARSIDLARAERDAASSIGADGIVIHSGAGGPGERAEAVRRAAASVEAILGDAADPPVILELTAGGLGTVASTIAAAAELIEGLGGDDRVKLCLDTCHLLSAGYRLDDPEAAASPFEELRRAGLDGRLRLLHANDSRDARGSRRDRHAHVGTGTIGETGFAAILGDVTVRQLPILIETPGDEPEDIANLATLRRLAAFDGTASG